MEQGLRTVHYGVHPTWAGTYILDACVFLFPDINFALIDSDCVPVTLFEIQELWLSCAESDSPADESRHPAAIPSSPIAPAQKRARSVDTGQATQQQPGPPIKLPKSRSVENLMASTGRSPTPAQSGIFEARSHWLKAVSAQTPWDWVTQF